jgi:predicted Fe-Mo cluster-binding NifX family protein
MKKFMALSSSVLLLLLFSAEGFSQESPQSQQTRQTQEQPVPADDRFAIAAEGKEVSATIAHLTGRAPYFHVYDIDGNAIEVFENPYLHQEFNIGPQMAVLLSDKAVTVLVGGMAGPKMKDVLDARGVRFVYRKGVVQDVVDELTE